MAQLEDDLSYFRNSKPLPPALLWEIVSRSPAQPMFETATSGSSGPAQIEAPLHRSISFAPQDRVHMRNRLPIFSSTRVGVDWDGEGQIGEPIP